MNTVIVIVLIALLGMCLNAFEGIRDFKKLILISIGVLIANKLVLSKEGFQEDKNKVYTSF